MYCPNCGTKIPDESKFCLNCGYKVSTESTQTTGTEQTVQEYNYNAETPKSEKLGLSGCLKITLVIICLIAFLVGIFIISLPSGNNGSDNTVTEQPTVEESQEETVTEGSQEEIQTPVISEEEYKNSCGSYTYEEISRNPDNYIGKRAFYTGQVVQVQEYNTFGVAVNYYRVSVTKQTYEDIDEVTYTDTIYVEYHPEEGESRILEGDIVSVWGELNGLESYTSVSGYYVTIPKMIAEYIAIEE